MIAGVVKEAAGVLDRRFLLNAFLPALTVLSGLALVIAGLEWGVGPAITRLGNQDTLLISFEVAGFVVAVAVLAGLLSSLESALFRLAEGYWSGPLRRSLGALGKQWHRRRLAALGERIADDTAYETVYLRYPLPTQPGEVMPTRLGNILKNAELYPRDRYEIDAVLVWPRLYPLLPERMASTLNAAQSDLALLLTAATCAAGFAVVAGGYVLAAGGSWVLFLGCFWGGITLAWLAYRASCSAAIGYAQLVKAAFDIGRTDLRAKLPDGDPDEDETAYWRRICAQWYRNVPTTPTPPAPEPPTPAYPPKGLTLPLSAWLLGTAAVLGAAGALLLA